MMLFWFGYRLLHLSGVKPNVKLTGVRQRAATGPE
jgi:hypothetical protein